MGISKMIYDWLFLDTDRPEPDTSRPTERPDMAIMCKYCGEEYYDSNFRPNRCAQCGAPKGR